MAPRKRSFPPVEIVLTEEEIETILRETLRPPEAPAPSPAAPPAAPVDQHWHPGTRSPGAVGDAIRMLLDATTLDRAKRPRLPGGM